MDNDIKILGILLTTSGMIFLLYERFLLQRGESWVYYISMTTIAVVLVTLVFRFMRSTKDSQYTFLVIIVTVYTLLKFGFVSSIPSSILLAEANVEYQVSSSLQLGHIQPISYYTLFAKSLATMPIVPIFNYALHTVSGYSLGGISKYFGAGITSVLIPLSYGMLVKSMESLRKCNSWLLSLLLILSSPWLLGALVWGHYAIFSTIFAAILLWIIIKNFDKKIDPGVTIMYIIITVALAFTHMYLLVSLFLIYTIYLVLTSISATTSKIKAIKHPYKMYLVYLTITLAYLVYLSRQFGALVFRIMYLKTAIEKGSLTAGISYYGTPKASPTFVVILKYSGVISLGILSTLSVAWYYLKSRRVEFLKYLLFLSILIGSLILFGPYLFDQRYGADLFNRVFYFGLLAVSPYISYYLSSHSNSKKHTLLSTLLIFVLLFGLLSAVRPDIVDWKTPIVTGEDIRLHLSEWYAAGRFSSNMPSQEIYGLRTGMGPIGLFMRKNYIQLNPSINKPNPLIPPEDLSNLPNFLKDAYVVLRLSMSEHPDPGFIVNKTDVLKLRSNNNANIIYACSDVFIINTL